MEDLYMPSTTVRFSYEFSYFNLQNNPSKTGIVHSSILLKKGYENQLFSKA